MLKGYLPSSGGLLSIYKTVSNMDNRHNNVTSHAPAFLPSDDGDASNNPVIKFYKAWDVWGAFSNFDGTPIRMFDGPGPHGRLPSSFDPNATEWPSVEHYYQAQKFSSKICDK